jgi:phosphoenolpyruvate carboxylase
MFGPDLPTTNEIADVLDTFRVIAELPADNFGAYIISMATAPSDVLAVELLQREYHVKTPLRVVPLFEKLADLEGAPAALATQTQVKMLVVSQQHGSCTRLRRSLSKLLSNSGLS